MDYLLNDEIKEDNNTDSENSNSSSKQNKEYHIKSHNKRYEILKLIGEGSFSKTYSAKDNLLNKSIAIKVEKPDKDKRILKSEYDILKALQVTKCIPRVYDYIEGKISFIVMELLGLNIVSYIKLYSPEMISKINILIQMLNAIEIIHNEGYVHRDIKPSNFVLGLKENKDKIYIVDFGLSKKHLDKNLNSIPAKKITDFRGTLTYASMNAHNKKELGRRDDLWSFYFIIYEMLGNNLPWRGEKNKKNNREEICKNKELCFSHPNLFIFLKETKYNDSLKVIFDYLNKLQYESKPNYTFIKDILENIQNKILFGSPLASININNSESNLKDKIHEKKKFVNKEDENQTENTNKLDENLNLIEKFALNQNGYIIEEKFQSQKVEKNIYSDIRELNNKLNFDLKKEPKLKDVHPIKEEIIVKDFKDLVKLILSKELNSISIFQIILLYHFFINKRLNQLKREDINMKSDLNNEVFEISSIRMLIKKRIELIKIPNNSILRNNIFSHNLKNRFPFQFVNINKSNSKRSKYLQRLIHSNKSKNKINFQTMIQIINLPEFEDEENEDEEEKLKKKRKYVLYNILLNKRNENFIFSHLKSFKEFSKRNEIYNSKFKLDKIEN